MNALLKELYEKRRSIRQEQLASLIKNPAYLLFFSKKRPLAMDFITIARGRSSFRVEVLYANSTKRFR